MKAGWTWIGSFLSVALLATLTIGCGGNAPTASISSGESANGVGDARTSGGGAASLTSDVSGSVVPPKNLFPQVLIKTSMGDVRIKLNADKAPLTVENFLENYVDRGFYSNTIFHHVDPNYILAGGYAPDLEPKAVRAPIRNEAANGLKNIRGTITMSRSPDYGDSATSQFFINTTPAPSLDYDENSDNAGYCVFGEVVQGMDVVDRIANAKVHNTGEFPQMPAEPILITSIERVD